jgi:3' terminal RNA ribose 2'-O-methyltransferase Hen1
MILQISTTHQPATDLGYLLHKNPDRLHHAELTFGDAWVFFPEASDFQCTATLLVDVDPVRLVRDRKGPTGEGGLLAQYVNDRPYAASSFLSTAIAEFFSTAMSGRSKERQELADSPIQLTATIPVIACRTGQSLIHQFFEPLGYTVQVENLPLDSQFPEWGDGFHYRVSISGTCILRDLLTHLYVLIPVVDNTKHYWVAQDEIEKLLRRGKGWLESHPSKHAITSRYLAHQKSLTREALAQLVDESDDPDEEAVEKDAEEQRIERPLSLHEQRLHRVVEVLKESGANRVVDLGCGEGKLLSLLMKQKQFQEILGMDVAIAALSRAKSNLKLDRLPPMQAQRIKLVHGSLLYRDKRVAGYDAAAVVEVIEHLDPPRLAAFQRSVFEFARPHTVVVTTPNREYNHLFAGMPDVAMRHRDHRFEWTRSEFEEWGTSVASAHGYKVEFEPIGPVDEVHGAPSQMGVFTRGA